MQATRNIIGLVLLIALCAAAYFVFVAMQGDDSKLIAIAFGNPDEQVIDIHIELTMSMVATDTLAYANVNGNTVWEKWAEAHYLIRDASGAQVPLRRAMKSNLTSDAQTRGFNDSFLIGKVKRGTEYTFTYLPVVGEPKQFVYSFTAPMEKLKRQRVSFKPSQ